MNRLKHSKDLIQLISRVGGHVWQFHKNDPDPWPGRPHGYDYDQNAELHVGTGEVHSPASKPHQARVVERMKVETLQEIRGLLSTKWPDVELPPLEIPTLRSGA